MKKVILGFLIIMICSVHINAQSCNGGTKVAEKYWIKQGSGQVQFRLFLLLPNLKSKKQSGWDWGAQVRVERSSVYMCTSSDTTPGGGACDVLSTLRSAL